MTKLALTAGTIAHAHRISSDLSDIHRAELEAKFGLTWFSQLSAIKEFLAAGPAVTLHADGEPVAIFGHMPHAQGTGRVTWFLATNRYFKLGARGVVYTRKYLQQLQRDFPDTEFVTYSHSPHPDAPRWFVLLGYQPMLLATTDYRGFRLPPKVRNERRDAPSFS